MKGEKKITEQDVNDFWKNISYNLIVEEHGARFGKNAIRDRIWSIREF